MRHTTPMQSGENSLERLLGLTRIFTIAAFFIIASGAAAYSQPDCIIRDCAADVGQQANSACNGVYYLSPDIWIRRNADGGTQHQQPSAGSNVTVYVQVKNIGTADLGFGTVALYYGARSTSLSNWPGHWLGNAPFGDFIGSADIYNLAPNNSTIVAIPWNQVPYNTVTGDHFCLLARFLSDEDPMATPEGNEISVNTINNNNIAWKNLTTIYAPPTGGSTVPGGSFSFHNGREYPVTTQLDFNTDDLDNSQPLPDGWQARLNLGPILHQRWADGGWQGLTSGVINEYWNNSVVITNTHESLGGILLNPNEEFSVEVEIIYSSEQPPSSDVHNWRISQREDGNPDPIGGIGFEIHMNQDEGWKRAVPQEGDLATKFDLSAQPNIGTSAMTIGFTLPSDDRVTLAIHDLNGRLVRALVSDGAQAAGRHAITWDGQSDDGVPVPAGTYFYSLSTREGVAKNQLKIVR